MDNQNPQTEPQTNGQHHPLAYEQVCTIRMPKYIHVMLKDAAHHERTSLNLLCLGLLRKRMEEKIAAGEIKRVGPAPESAIPPIGQEEVA